MTIEIKDLKTENYKSLQELSIEEMSNISGGGFYHIRSGVYPRWFRLKFKLISL